MSRRSCTRKTVARISFVSWSSTKIFQTGGPVVAGTLSVEAAFDGAEVLDMEGSRGLLRLSIESKALVCACCTVTGVVACIEGQVRVTGTYKRAYLLECMARHDCSTQWPPRLVKVYTLHFLIWANQHSHFDMIF